MSATTQSTHPSRAARAGAAVRPAPAGPLAALLTRGRELFTEELPPGPVHAGPAMRAFTCALLAEQTSTLLAVTASDADAEALRDGLAAFLGDEEVAFFPSWETLPHERLSPQASTVGARLRVLDRLADDAGGLRAVVAPVRALLQPMDPRLTERRPVRVDPSWGRGLDGLVEALAQLGYTRTTLVEHRGEFAVRGGIVDLFPTAADHAVRVEFWGDDVDSLREFSAADQRSLDAVDSIVVDAARELVLDEETAATARILADRVPALADQLHLLADGVAFEGMESLVTAIHPAPAFLPEFLPQGSGVVIVDPLRVRGRADELREQAEALMVAGWGATGPGAPDRTATNGGGAAGRRSTGADVAKQDGHGLQIGTGGPGASGGVGFAALDDVRRRLPERSWELDPFGQSDVPGQPFDSFRGDVVAAAALVGRLIADGHLVVLSTAGHGPALRLSQVLREHGVAAPVVDRVDAGSGAGPDAPQARRDAFAPHPAGGRTGPGRVLIVESPLREGFRSPELGIALLGEWDLFGPRRSRAARRLPSRRAAAETVVDLRPGDPVVHRVHGVGRYVGIVTRQLRGPTAAVGGGSAGDLTRDYVIVEYAGGDRLFVPSDNVDAVAPYVGGEDPRIMRMGGSEWDRAKTKVRKAVREMAAELIRLYQARMHAPGTAFSPDTEWQLELETAFPHEETPDQVSAIDEVKQDMEAPLPMDRLICGDVGFGKTEIAVRAAAKCIFDGKQTAVLVPTTLLAQQHGETFRERFSGFPVDIRVLSRFSSTKEVREILDGLAAGTVDLVVGTHRLLGTDVRFKDLGLVIVDEEQRFGVAHKEKLKQLRTAVDVLTMTATPIPRTMEMAIAGIRDLSTIDTPPEDRQPVITHVGEWDENLAALAVRRELLREGQVFWVHNQVSTISQAAQAVKELVPGARVEMAHGQMDEAVLEQVMVRFWHREFDVLVSTTIVESGLDVPNANTLVIERADMLGLAQLHQLRGRVGRSTHRGYAYLFHPQDRQLTEEAYKRLETIAGHASLGSGLSVALKDLEIRGAGDVLSGEQSGHVASVGFEAYAQLMKEAVEDLQRTAAGQQPREPEVEITIDLPVDAHVPTAYVPDESLRLEAYRKIAAVRDSAGVKAVTAELIDRYGPLPTPAQRLLHVAALRAAARRWGITEITTTPRRTVRVTPVSLSDSQEVRLSRERPNVTWNATASALELPMPLTGELIGHVARELGAILSQPRGRR